MATWYVYLYIHVQTPHRTVPKLFVTDVPDDKTVGWDLVDEYGDYSEFPGMQHSNHGIAKLTKDSDPEVKRAWRNGEVKRVQYKDLVKLAETI